ncbi:alpha/beta hydrolase [Amphritea japonica]|uniref:Uncharacterized protein n=1 Tax=Amphritea japonica ATCC BAA-1530 TaxID=1278309 RepID=A0A7R6P5A3_9GAMM|nr:hypothetical protein [Amphritea japonica]BBB27603.1 conserved hypothetical protein [Amphritea japonica ATCC BAA-1530]
MRKVNEQLPLPGEVQKVIFPAISGLPFWLYQPVKVRNMQRILVVVHGISRDAKEQLDCYRVLADELGCWLVAPQFKSQNYPRYQQLCAGSGQPRADVALNSFLALWRGMHGQPYLKIWLAGYSGGAQFAHRYALHHPQQIAAMVLGSAGWYSFPDQNIKYPRGITRTQALGPVRLDEMLSIPMLVTVGDEDNLRDSSLRTSKSLDQQQGRNRLERALSWCGSIRQLQQEKTENPVQLEVLSGQGHNFYKNMQQGGMAASVLQFLLQSEGSNNAKNTDSIDRCTGHRYLRVSG